MGDTSTPAASAPDIGQDTSDEPDPRLLRALADLDNTRKRYERRLATASEDERNRVVSLWLPIVDDLERALQHAESDAERVVPGVRAVYEHALDVLAGLGLERFDDVGEQFDPGRHDAVAAVSVDAPAGSIVATAQPGYATKAGTVRPARVIVADANSQNNESSG